MRTQTPLLWGKRSSKFRGAFHSVCTLVLLFLFYNHENVLKNSILVKPKVIRRRITETNDINVKVDNLAAGNLTARDTKFCSGLFERKGYPTRCEYLISHPDCTAGGFFNYIKFLYCSCEKFSFLGFAVLAVWLVALFYLLGNTAADYFCCSLEKLSNLLKMSPSVAGVTLLPLGNGAPDVFASIAAFVGKDSGEVGINSVLGGAVFVTCVVVGIISLCIAERRVQIDRNCFVRDIGFLLFSLIWLFLLLTVGKVTVGTALLFVLLYLIYVIAVALNEFARINVRMFKLGCVITPLQPVKGATFCNGDEEGDSVYASFLESDPKTDVPCLEKRLPHWMWASQVAIYSNEPADSPKSLWGWNDEETLKDRSSFPCSKCLSLLELPLTLPRRLTIPIVEEERWSKGFAVASATLAPILLAFLWNIGDDAGPLSKEIVYFIGVMFGGILGVSAYLYTRSDQPPRRFLLPWVFGGFFMSIVWFYIIANELVALLVALGVIFGINPSILALTLLAWGNSMGDLMSNIALATNDGDGVQIAMSGCYAGPMFNTLAGLGISLVFGAWHKRPAPYLVPRDGSLFCTMGFLATGLIWSYIVLPWNDMRPSKTLGVGLIIIYSTFLIVRVSTSMGVSDF